MILIPKYKDIYNKTPVTHGFKAKGEYRMVLMNSMGGIVQDTGWHQNLITDYGLNLWGQHSATFTPWSYFHIGSGSTPPATGDTALTTWLAYSSSVISNLRENLGPSTYIARQTQGYRFAAGVGTGTIREFGTGPSSSNINMCVHTLVSPEVNKAADQVLDVYYRFSVYPDLTDNTGSVLIDGQTYDWVSRVARIEDYDAPMYFMEPYPSPTYHWVSSSTTLGPVTDGLLPTWDGASQLIQGNEVGTTVEWQTVWSLEDGVVPGGYIGTALTSMTSALASSGYFGIKASFVNQVGGLGIPKDNTQKLTLDWSATVSRH